MRFKVVAPALAVFFFTGCIEFARQTVSYRHDAATDTLYIFQDYQGIFGANNPNRLGADEAEQLASVMKGERTFLFNNWILEYNRAELEEELKKPKGEIDSNPEYEAAIRVLAQSALANVRIENVGFYTNKEGQLCGAQRVTIRHCSKVLAALNPVLLHAVRKQAEERADTPEAQKQFLRKLAASGESLVRLDGNRVEIRWPVSEADYREFHGSPQGKAIREAGGSTSYDDGLLAIRVGDARAEKVSLTLPFAKEAYTSNALGEATSYGIKAAFNSQQAAAQFLAQSTPKRP